MNEKKLYPKYLSYATPSWGEREKDKRMSMSLYLSLHHVNKSGNIFVFVIVKKAETN